MHTPESTRRPWFDLRAAVILGFLALAACFVGWKWWESYSRDRCLSDLVHGHGSHSVTIMQVPWSTQWPFRNVETITAIELKEGDYSDEVVRTLQSAFPGVSITFLTKDDLSLEALPELP